LSIDNQRRQRGKEERNSSLLIDGDGAEDGEGDMGVRGEQGDQGKKLSGHDRDPALSIE
jgi:hypothetical protein